jgi:adhesin/invasin
VIVRDNGGNPVPNVAVTFAVTAGGGQLQGATQTTNAQGVATVTSWRLGAATGTNTVTATVTGLTPVTFTATATAGAPVQVQKTAGDNQTAQVNRPVPVAPTVRVLDAGGNGVAGVAVTFAVESGGGSAVVANAVTAADGRASIGAWILGPAPGDNTLSATVTGLAPVTFLATATGGTAVTMQPLSLVTQNGVAGQNATSPPSVVVRDALGNPVAGVTVNFTVTAGSGTLQGAQQVTNANGIATVTTWTFGTVAGLNTVIASSTGLANVFFNGQGIGGIPVTFAVTAGGGTLAGASPVTDAAGVATVTSWTLGAGAAQTITATVGASGVVGNPVTFTASAATNIGITQQPPANTTSGSNFTVIVQLRDAVNALSPVDAVPLTISIATGGGTLNAGGTALTVNTVGGVATFNVNLTGASGARTLRITGTGVGNVVTTSVTLP